MSPIPLALRIIVQPLPDRECVAPAEWLLALQSGRSDLVRGTANDDRVVFDFEVRVKQGRDGSPDFGGPLVHGGVDDRFSYLSWGRVDRAGAHTMFRRLKVYLSPVARKGWSSPGLTWAQIQTGERVHIVVSGRLADGTPNCGTAHALWVLGRDLERLGAGYDSGVDAAGEE